MSGAGSRRPHGPRVHRCGGRPPLGNGPDDQALTTCHVAAHEDALEIRAPTRVGGDRAARVEVESELPYRPAALGSGEPEREQDQLTLHRELASGDGFEAGPAVDGRCDDLVPTQGLEGAVLVADELRRGHRIQALAALLVGARGSEDEWPGGPRVVRGSVLWGPGQDLELVDGPGALPVRGAQAVRPRVSAADDDHVLAVRIDWRAGEGSLLDEIGALQVLHGEADPVELPARDREVARPRGPARQHGGVEAIAQGARREHLDVGRAGRTEPVFQPRVDRRASLRLRWREANGGPAPELDALESHLLEAAVEHALFHLEFRYAVAQEPSGAFRALKDDDVVSGAGQLLRGKPGRRDRTR